VLHRSEHQRERHHHVLTRLLQARLIPFVRLARQCFAALLLCGLSAVTVAQAIAASADASPTSTDASAHVEAEFGQSWERSTSPLVRVSPDGALVQLPGLSKLAGPVSRLLVNGSREWATSGPIQFSANAVTEVRWSPTARDLDLAFGTVDVAARWSVGGASLGVSPSHTVLGVAGKSFRATDSLRVDWTRPFGDGELWSIRVEPARYRHAVAFADLDADVLAMTGNIRWKFAEFGLDKVELAWGVRRERNRNGYVDLSNRGAHVSLETAWPMLGAQWSATVLLQRTRFDAAGPDGLPARRDRYVSTDLTAEWPLSKSTYLRVSVSNATNHSTPALYENRHRSIEVSVGAHW
jgi:hypothetical protein